jgi:hypothetical protein
VDVHDSEPRRVVHRDPAWRDRTNFIVQLDLAAHGVQAFEQCWTRTSDQQNFELCCIPFFPYGISLGDTISVDRTTGAHTVVAKAGHRTIRVFIKDDDLAHRGHSEIHGQLTGELGCAVEFHGSHYVAVDLVGDQQVDAVVSMLRPYVDAGRLIWEWADPRLDD